MNLGSQERPGETDQDPGHRARLSPNPKPPPTPTPCSDQITRLGLREVADFGRDHRLINAESKEPRPVIGS